jgi:hypothetical protein
VELVQAGRLFEAGSMGAEGEDCTTRRAEGDRTRPAGVRVLHDVLTPDLGRLVEGRRRDGWRRG